MTLLLASAARATVGTRSGQEDAFRLWPADGKIRAGNEAGLLAVLADGMGGHTGGAVAGRTACAKFTDIFSTSANGYAQRLGTALEASNRALAESVASNAALRGMGCTLIGAWLDQSGIRWASVGDSLLLLYRFPDVIRLNADHSLGSLLDEQARQKRISEAEAKEHRNRNALRSALTGSKIELIDLRSEPLELRAGDWIVLASDGLCTLAGDEMADIIYRHRQATPEEMAEALIEGTLAKRHADQDNTTVVAVRIDAGTPAADEATTRIIHRPSESDDRDLRTRRIGVSRPKAVPPTPVQSAVVPRATTSRLLEMPRVLWLAAGTFVAAAVLGLLLRPLFFPAAPPPSRDMPAATAPLHSAPFSPTPKDDAEAARPPRGAQEQRRRATATGQDAAQDQPAADKADRSGDAGGGDGGRIDDKVPPNDSSRNAREPRDARDGRDPRDARSR